MSMVESFAQMFEESLASQRIRPGQILTGRVIEVGPDVVVVSAGLKSEAVIPVAQFKNERGRLPDINAADAWEKRMAEGVAALARYRAQAKAAEGQQGAGGNG